MYLHGFCSSRSEGKLKLNGVLGLTPWRWMAAVQEGLKKSILISIKMSVNNCHEYVFVVSCFILIVFLFPFVRSCFESPVVSCHLF